VDRAFIDQALESNILVVVLPPHSTHRLQPLDVSVFRPLAQAYSQELDSYVQNSYGFSSVTKRVFWQLFWPAWDRSVVQKNIQSGYRKSGIWPLSPAEVLLKLAIRPKSDTSDTEDEPIAPLSVREVRNLTREIHNSSISLSQTVSTLIDSAELLSVQNEILRHDVGRLQATLIEERQHRVKGKAIGLLSPDQPKYGQFFSPERIQQRRNQEAAQLEENNRQKAANLEAKIQKQLEKQHREQERRDRVERNKQERLAKRAQKEVEKQQRQQLRQLQKQQKDQEKQAKRTPKRRPKQHHILANALILHPELFQQEDKGIPVSRSGRRIALPHRFLE
jgi:DDE superfamily endonuclease